jgi:creatinine amidohydrolase
MSKKFLYAEMTWPDIVRLAKEDRVAILPVATIEAHGPHLPLDTDVVICQEICLRACQQIPREVLLLPPITYGYSAHLMDFPGTISLEGNALTQCVQGICQSLARHGFRRILIVNGHGLNPPYLDAAAQSVVAESQGQVVCATISYWGLARLRQAVRELRESEPGGICHACEMETSLCLAIRPEMVDMSQAVDDLGLPVPDSFRLDMFARVPGSSALMFGPYWSTVSQSGILGAARKATPEKGEQFLKAAAEGLMEVIGEVKQMPIRPRVDHH